MRKSLRKVFTVLTLVCLVIFFTACTDTNSEKEQDRVTWLVTVTFVYNNGTPNDNKVVEKNSVLTRPRTPTRQNHVFDGWYTDRNFNYVYDFGDRVTTSFILYAKWDIDFPALQNKIMTSTIRACVSIEVKFYNTFLGIETSSRTKTGSGVIIDEGVYSNSPNSYYYVLTNNHVTYKGADYSDYSNTKITVIDYLNNTYTAQYDKGSISYDLSCLYFTKTRELAVVTAAASNPSVDDDIVSIGQPKGQTNAVTYGKVTDYRKITLTNGAAVGSLVRFDVLGHSAPIASGSSGGPVFDTNLNIVGINFAGSSSDVFDNVGASYAIPIERLKEFTEYI